MSFPFALFIPYRATSECVKEDQSLLQIIRGQNRRSTDNKSTHMFCLVIWIPNARDMYWALWSVGLELGIELKHTWNGQCWVSMMP